MELDRSLLVEAGAGSGKTSVMAGRIAMLLANGVEPKNVAAITFTEFAASELLSRIVRFVGALAKGKILRDLEIAFPQGVSTSQRAAIAQAENFIDQLACSTIHGFAQSLIKPYPVEAGIDPGADIIDPAEADLAFAESYDAWIRDRLSGVHSDEIIAELVVADEGSGLSLIRQVADFRRRNRDARPDCVEWSNSAIGKFAAAVVKFASEIDGTGFDEPDTKQTSEDFVKLIDQMSGWSLDNAFPRCRDLVAVLTLPHPVSCFTSTGMRVLKTKGKWEQAAARAGKPKAQGSEAYQSVKALYVACHEAFNLLLAQTAGEVLARLSRSMDGLMVDWKAWKRDAALLDFDDLLYTARDLVRDHGEVRQSLSKRFRHVLVDEFQDTDPLQIDRKRHGDPT